MTPSTSLPIIPWANAGASKSPAIEHLSDNGSAYTAKGAAAPAWPLASLALQSGVLPTLGFSFQSAVRLISNGHTLTFNRSSP